jgi:ABC-type multidrug transport system ATPase subunit
MPYTVEKLKKNYDDRVVLDIPWLQIEPEKSYALRGPNGAGKSTL